MRSQIGMLVILFTSSYVLAFGMPATAVGALLKTLRDILALLTLSFIDLRPSLLSAIAFLLVGRACCGCASLQRIAAFGVFAMSLPSNIQKSPWMVRSCPD